MNFVYLFYLSFDYYNIIVCQIYVELIVLFYKQIILPQNRIISSSEYIQTVEFNV
jgi:hypothetical protein